MNATTIPGRESGSRAGRTLGNSAASLARFIAGALFSIATSAVLARYLGTSGYGALGYALWFATSLAAVAGWGAPLASTRYVAEARASSAPEAERDIARRLLIFQLCSVVALSALAWLITVTTWKQPFTMRIAALLAVPIAIQNGAFALLRGQQRYRYLAWVSIAFGCLQLTAASLIAFRRADARAFMVLLALVYSITAAAALWNTGIASDVKDRVSAEMLRRMRRFVAIEGYIVLMDLIVFGRIEIVFLKHWLGTEQVGIYTAAYVIAAGTWGVGAALCDSLLPAFTEIQSSGRSPKAAFTRVLQWQQRVFVPLCFIAAMLSGSIVRIVFGVHFQAAVIPLFLFLATAPVLAAGHLNSAVLYAREAVLFTAAQLTVLAALNIVLDILLIPRMGVVGAAAATLSVQIAGVVIGLLYAAHKINAQIPWTSLARIYAAGIFATIPLGLAVTRHWSAPAVASLVLVGFIVYAWLLSVLQDVDHAELSQFGAAVLHIVPWRVRS